MLKDAGKGHETGNCEGKIIIQHFYASIYYYIVALECTFKGLCKLFSLIRIPALFGNLTPMHNPPWASFAFVKFSFDSMRFALGALIIFFLPMFSHISLMAAWQDSCGLGGALRTGCHYGAQLQWGIMLAVVLARLLFLPPN